MSIVDLLRARSRLREPAKPKPITTVDVLRVFGGGRVLPFPEKERQPVATLAVHYADTYPSPPIPISEGVTVTDPKRFATKVVSELGRYVTAVNIERNTSIGKYYLIEEKIRALSLCGVTVEIKGVNDTEPELRPLKVSPPDPDFKPNKPPEFKRVQIGLSDSEVRDIFSGLGIDPDSRAGLPDDILVWLKRCDAVQAETAKTRETLSQMTEPERWQFLGLSDGPINWTENENPPVAWAWTPTAGDLKTVKRLQGKKGGVFCRSCYCPMQISIVNSGYDWYCDGCGIVWRYRYRD
jgi:hypothetical protein